MKYAKMLGPAVLAALVLAALLGAGSASATVLCTKNEIPCPKTEDWAASTPVDASLEVGSSLTISNTGGTTLSTCTDSTLKGETENTGKEAENVTVKNTELTFKECTNAMVGVKPGRLTIEYIKGSSTEALLLAVGTQITVSISGISCVYGVNEGGLVVGKATGATKTGVAKFHIDKAKAILEKVEGGFLCPGDVTWGAEYTVTEPTPLYFKERTA